MSFKILFTGGGINWVEADGLVDAATQAEALAVAATAKLNRTERGRMLLGRQGGSVRVTSIVVER